MHGRLQGATLAYTLGQLLVGVRAFDGYIVLLFYLHKYVTLAISTALTKDYRRLPSNDTASTHWTTR